MSNQIHRDIYSGMVAEEMNKEGVFGHEIDLYAFYVWKNDTADIHYFTDENDTVHEMIDQYNHGYPVSDWVMLRERLEGAADDGEVPSSLYTKAMVKLMKDQQGTLQAARIRASAGVAQENNDAIRSFVLKFDDQGTDAKFGILAAFRAEGVIGLVPFAKLYDTLKKPEAKGREISGFAWVEEGAVKTYVNAYLPTVWIKWRDMQKKTLVSPIATKFIEDDQTPVYQLKGAYEETLKTMYSKSFFTQFKKLLTE
jgi:hypothetical protein